MIDLTLSQVFLYLRRRFLPVPDGCCPDVEACLGSGVLLLERAGIETARLDVECILAEVLGLSRWQVILEPRRRLTPEAFGEYLWLLQRREQREPLANVLGKREFWSLPLSVSSGVLVPRPETETLVEATLALWRETQPAVAASREPRTPGVATRPAIVELCTGSGAVAIALARELPEARLLATDISWRALRVARANAAAHGVGDRILWLRGNLWRAVNGEAPAGSLDLVVANPPYIPSAAIEGLIPEVQWEPRRALDGGPDGLQLVREIVVTSPDRLRAGGWLLLEIGADQAAAATELFVRSGRFATPRHFRDLAGRVRVVAAQRTANLEIRWTS
jgi:release factor glutamine methyltransferase